MGLLLLSLMCSVHLHYIFTTAPQRQECLLNCEDQLFFFLSFDARIELLLRTLCFLSSLGGHVTCFAHAYLGCVSLVNSVQHQYVILMYNSLS